MFIQWNYYAIKIYYTIKISLFVLNPTENLHQIVLYQTVTLSNCSSF